MTATNATQVLWKKARSAIGFLAQGELFLFCRALVTNLFPQSLLGMGKYYFYSMDAHEAGTIDSDGAFSFACEGREAIPELAYCYQPPDPETTLEAFRKLYQDNTELWCARDLALPHRPIVSAIWLFRRFYDLPLEGPQFSICLDLQADDRVFLGTAYTHSSYRRRRLFARVIAATGKGRAELELLGCVHADNGVSIAAHKKIGSRWVGTVHYVRLGRRMWCYIRFPGVARRWRQIRKGKQIVVEAKPEGTAFEAMAPSLQGG